MRDFTTFNSSSLGDTVKIKINFMKTAKSRLDTWTRKSSFWAILKINRLRSWT